MKSFLLKRDEFLLLGGKVIQKEAVPGNNTVVKIILQGIENNLTQNQTIYFTSKRAEGINIGHNYSMVVKNSNGYAGLGYKTFGVWKFGCSLRKMTDYQLNELKEAYDKIFYRANFFFKIDDLDYVIRVAKELNNNKYLDADFLNYKKKLQNAYYSEQNVITGIVSSIDTCDNAQRVAIKVDNQWHVIFFRNKLKETAKMNIKQGNVITAICGSARDEMKYLSYNGFYFSKI